MGTTAKDCTFDSREPSTGGRNGNPYNVPGDIIRWELQDLVFFGYLSIVILLLLVFGVVLGGHPHPWLIILYHIAIAAAGMGARLLPAIWNSPVSRILRWWYPAILFLFCFKAAGEMIHIIVPEFLDPYLIAADRLLLGGDITIWLQQKANPWLTEIMYFCYANFYFYIPGIGLPLYMKYGMERSNPEGAFAREFMATITISFLFCYLHFFITPAAGPILWPDYPGSVLTLEGGPITIMEQWVFDRGTIVGGAFPSSHVVIAIVSAVYAVRFRVAPRFWVPITIGLTISTLYNGYHYGVDVLYAIVIATVMVIVVPRIFNSYESRCSARSDHQPQK